MYNRSAGSDNPGGFQARMKTCSMRCSHIIPPPLGMSYAFEDIFHLRISGTQLPSLFSLQMGHGNLSLKFGGDSLHFSLSFIDVTDQIGDLFPMTYKAGIFYIIKR